MKWDTLSSNADELKVEALRAIAEELEKHNVLLERMCTAFEDSKAQFAGAVDDLELEKANLKERIDRAICADEPETPRQRHARLFPGLPWNPPAEPEHDEFCEVQRGLTCTCKQPI